MDNNLDQEVNGGEALPEEEFVSLGERAEEMIRARIAHTLSIYPKLSHSMLQIGIGTGFPPSLWNPVLDAMIREGTIIREQVQATNPVTKRDQTYTIIRSSTSVQEAA
jgi:hypothetical protein